MAIPSRYAVKSATLTFGGATYDMDTGPVFKSATQDAVEVTALSDSVKQFITGALTEYDEFSVTLFQGSTNIEVGATGALSIAVTLENGGSDVTATVSYVNCIVTKVAGSGISASSDRKATYEVTFRPDGQVAAS